jgi:hypothetical protein
MYAPHRSSSKLFARAALWCLVLLAPSAARSQALPYESFGARPRSQDLDRAARVLTRLGMMREAASAPDGKRALRKVSQKIYPGLFVTVAEMRPSELKTELDTAVYLFEGLARMWSSLGADADCDGQRPDTYRPLCRRLHDGSGRELLLAKASLHASWAEALLRLHRGRADGDTLALLTRLQKAREYELLIAADVLDVCRRLGDLFPRLASAGGEAQRGATGLPYNRDLSERAVRLLAEAEFSVASLPRSPLRYKVEGALGAYRDGLLWLERLERSNSRVVSVEAMSFNPLEELRISPATAHSALAANFSHARAYTMQAERTLFEARRTLHPDRHGP